MKHSKKTPKIEYFLIRTATKEYKVATPKTTPTQGEFVSKIVERGYVSVDYRTKVLASAIVEVVAWYDIWTPKRLAEPPQRSLL